MSSKVYTLSFKHQVGWCDRHVALGSPVDDAARQFLLAWFPLVERIPNHHNAQLSSSLCSAWQARGRNWLAFEASMDIQ